MDRDTVVRLAREAVFQTPDKNYPEEFIVEETGINDDLMRFATLIANETLERAAKATLDESVDGSVSHEDQVYNTAIRHAASAIRALKE